MQSSIVIFQFGLALHTIAIVIGNRDKQINTPTELGAVSIVLLDEPRVVLPHLAAPCTGPEGPLSHVRQSREPDDGFIHDARGFCALLAAILDGVVHVVPDTPGQAPKHGTTGDGVHESAAARRAAVKNQQHEQQILEAEAGAEDWRAAAAGARGPGVHQNNAVWRLLPELV